MDGETARLCAFCARVGVCVRVHARAHGRAQRRARSVRACVRAWVVAEGLLLLVVAGAGVMVVAGDRHRA